MTEAISFASRIVLGTVQFGMNYGISNTSGRVPQEEVCRILEYAYAKGIRTLDTAAAYGESETALGKAMQETRLSFNIISKLPPVQTASDVRKKLEESLRKLQVEKLNGYMLHNFSIYQQTPLVMKELNLLQQEGLIEKTGVSLYHPKEALELLDKGENFNLTQFPYSVFDQRFDSVLETLEQHRVEVHARSAFLQGLFFMNPATLSPYFTNAIPAIRDLQQLAKQSDIPLEVLLLLFVLSQPNITKVTIGVNSLQDLRQNLEAEKYSAQARALLPELKKYRLNDLNILLPYKWKTA